MIASESLELSRKTTVNWRLFCYKVTHMWFHNHDTICGEEEQPLRRTPIFTRSYKYYISPVQAVGLLRKPILRDATSRIYQPEIWILPRTVKFKHYRNGFGPRRKRTVSTTDSTVDRTTEGEQKTSRLQRKCAKLVSHWIDTLSNTVTQT